MYHSSVIIFSCNLNLGGIELKNLILRKTFYLCLSLFSLSFNCLANADCQTQQEIEKLILNREETLLKTKAQLERLYKGDTSTTFNPESLFIVDLHNSNKVASRIEELREAIDIKKSTYLEKFRSCIPATSTLNSDLDNLANIEQEINRLRLNFLLLPTERRQTLLSIFDQASNQKTSLKALSFQVLEAEKKSSQIEEALIKAESLAQRATNEEQSELLTSLALFEKTRKDISNLSLEWTQDLEETTVMAGKFSEELSREASILSNQEKASTVEVRNGYNAVTKMWRKLVDLLFSKLRGNGKTRNIPTLVSLPKNLNSKMNQNYKEAENLENVYLLMRKETKELIALRDKVENQENTILYRLFVVSGNLRTQFLDELSKRQENFQYSLNNDYLRDLFREIRLIPYRPVVFIRNVALDTSRKLENGVSGVLSLVKQFLILLLFVLIPIVTFFLIRRFSNELDALRMLLARSNLTYGKASFFALWVRRLNSYLSWIMMFVASKLADLTVKGTYFEGLAEILPYFEYFIMYRVFRLVLSEVIVSSASFSSSAMSTIIGPKIEKTARFLGLFFLVAAFLLQATQTITHKALFYHLIQEFLFYLTTIWLATATFWWKKELSFAATVLLPNSLGIQLSKACLSKWAWFICLPTVMVLFFMLVSKKIYQELYQFNSIKRISVRLFRRKLETAAKNKKNTLERKPPTQKYLSHFELNIPTDLSFLISLKNSPEKAIIKAIENWSLGLTAEHMLAIQGETGVGKSCLLLSIEKHFSKYNVKKVSIPSKITSEKELYFFLEKSLGIICSEGHTNRDLSESNVNKRLILLDEGQNLFLAHRGGFSAFKAFINLCNRPDKNIFWCVVINHYAWSYLNAVTGGSQFFRHVFKINRWSDVDICSLILTRHNKTNYQLEYDPIIFATKDSWSADELKLAQNRYFELLWEQSRGNPRTALILWTSALEMVGEKRLRVGIPTSSPLKPLACLTDEELFVIAAIIRHENLTLKEAISVTSLPDGVVCHALSVGIERGFLERSENDRYRIRPLWQSPLSQTLIHKNFIYG